MTERVLLAGCGDLGLRVARRLLARRDQVWALRRTPPGPDVRADPSLMGLEWLHGDLASETPLPPLPAGITQLVYLPAPDARDEAVYRALFERGLPRMLNALDAASLRRVLLVSSSAVYGQHEGEWVDEETPPAPQGFNGAVLLQTECWLRAQAVPSISLRLAGLYGPGRLQLLERIRAGRARAPRHPPHWANRIHIEDAAGAVAHLLSLAQPQAVYIGCDDTPLPLHVLYAHLARLAQAPSPPEGPAPAAIGSKKLSNARLCASGYAMRWPDSRDGYAALLATASSGN